MIKTKKKCDACEVAWSTFQIFIFLLEQLTLSTQILSIVDDV